jgi:type IV secretion system protein VirD4
VYSTAQTLVQPWEDPRLARASEQAPQVDLPWLLSGTGANTLYVSQPLKGADRLAVIFGGLLGDLIADQAYDIAKRSGCALPDLLVVIDEAGNTPVRWLPQVASTCCGIGINLVTVWQSKAQIDARYQALSDSVLTNHATKVIFAGTSDGSTGRYAAFLGGEEEVEDRSRSEASGSARRSSSVRGTRVPLLPADVLRRAKAGSALLVHGTLPPAHLVARHVSQERRLGELAAGRARVPEPAIMDERLGAALDALRAERER